MVRDLHLSWRCLAMGLVLGLLVLLSSPVAAQAPRPLGFGIIGTQAPEELKTMWGPILADLSDRLGRPVEPMVFEDYAGVVWAMRGGKIALAWTGNMAAVVAVDRAGAEVFAQKVDVGGADGYYSYLLVRAASGLETVEQVMDKAPALTLGLGDPNSTSGTLVPGYFLFARQGIDPRRLFKRVTRGSHEDNFNAVVDGRADVVTTASDHFRRFCAQRAKECEGVRVVWQSPAIPMDPLLWRKDLGDDDKARIRAFFLDYGAEREGKPARVAEAERKRLQAIGASRFRSSGNHQLRPIREIEAYYARAREDAPATSKTGE